jgi:hypothetical protein
LQQISSSEEMFLTVLFIARSSSMKEEDRILTVEQQMTQQPWCALRGIVDTYQG